MCNLRCKTRVHLRTVDNMLIGDRTENSLFFCVITGMIEQDKIDPRCLDYIPMVEKSQVKTCQSKTTVKRINLWADAHATR